MKIAKKVVDRVLAGLKQFKPIADQHKTRDVSKVDLFFSKRHAVPMLWF